jgi:hypothetical protein
MGGVDDRGAGANREIVAIKRDVYVSQRDGGVEQLARHRVQALREDGAAAVDPDQGDRAGEVSVSLSGGVSVSLPDGVLLNDLVCDPHQRATHVIAIEDDRVLLQTCLLLPGLSGPG